VAASGLRLGREQNRMRTGPHRLGLDMCWYRTPAWVLFKARVCSVLGPWDPTVGGPDPIREGGLDPIPGVRLAHVEVRDQPWGSGLYIRGSGALPWGSGPLLMPWSISPSLDTWRLRTRPCGGVGRRCGPRVAARDWGDSWLGPTHSTFTT
jgi:hypothetical protein